MQLKLQRSQRDSGLISKTVIFCLDARVHFTAEEVNHIVRYRLANEVVYSSQAAQRYAARGDAQAESGTIGGNLKSIASYVMARLQLIVTVGSLGNGQHIECKSLDELLEAEAAIMTACQNIKAYLNTAATFDGGADVWEFTDEGPRLVAQSRPAGDMAVLPPLPEPAIAGALAAPAAAFSAIPPEAMESPGAYRAGRTLRSFFDPGPEGDRQMKTVLVIGAIILFLIMIAYRSAR